MLIEQLQNLASSSSANFAMKFIFLCNSETVSVDICRLQTAEYRLHYRTAYSGPQTIDF